MVIIMRELAIEFIKKIIGNGTTRKILLEQLLSGEKSGLELRQSLGKSSDSKLYFNLSVLETAKIISSRKEWRDKYFKIKKEEYKDLIREILKKNKKKFI